MMYTDNFVKYLKKKIPAWCHLLFYFTSYVLYMFRTLIYPSSRACEYSVELQHWSMFLVWCVLEFRFGWVGVVSVLQAEACTQHVSDINISIIGSLRLFCWITTLVVLFLVRCVLEFRCGWVGVVSVLQASACNTNNVNPITVVLNLTHSYILKEINGLLRLVLKGHLRSSKNPHLSPSWSLAPNQLQHFKLDVMQNRHQNVLTKRCGCARTFTLPFY